MAQPTLAERLGYGPEDRLLIVNCDDLGSSHGANVASLRAMVHRVATSATLMVACPWAREAVRSGRATRRRRSGPASGSRGTRRSGSGARRPWPRRTRDVFFEEIPKLSPGVSEIFAHPVPDGEELRAYDTRHADIRAHQLSRASRAPARQMRHKTGCGAANDA